MLKLGSCVAIGLLVASSALAAPAPKVSDDIRQFLDVVRANFTAWDFEHKGQLTKAEIEKDMQNPAFKGDAAAALAGMKWGLEKIDPKIPTEATSTNVFTLAELDTIESTISGGGKVINPSFFRSVQRFKTGQKIIQNQSRALFAADSPHLAAIRQDWDSDCYFNSAIGSLAQAAPQAIVKLIKTNPDGSFTVTYPGKAAQKIPAPTDAEIAAYTDATDGIWFNVLEKAYANIRKVDPKKATDEPMDAATLIGGDENFVLGLVSGHQMKVTRFPLVSNKSADAKFLQQVRDDLSAAFREHRAVVTSKFHHAFAVVAFDPRTDTITIHNPYDGNGGEGMPSGESDLSSGGFFSISTEKFVENFNNMGVEQSALAAR